MKKLILLVFVVVSVTGCNGCNNKNATQGEAIIVETIIVADGHNARNSLDYAGTYKGTVPCADCEGIKLEIVINDNGTYEYNAEYLGKPEKSQYNTSGSFSWSTNDDMITLLEMEQGHNRFKVGENTLIMLDENYNIITGDLSDMYILRK